MRTFDTTGGNCVAAPQFCVAALASVLMPKPKQTSFISKSIEDNDRLKTLMCCNLAKVSFGKLCAE